MSWLDPFVQGTQWEDRKALAKAIPVNGDKTLKRWETFETKQPTRLRKLAQVLGVDRQVFQKAHDDALAAYEAECVAEAPFHAKEESQVDARILAHAFHGVYSPRFTALVLAGARLASIEEVADRLAQLIKLEDTPELLLVLNRAIEPFRTDATSEDIPALERIADVYAAVLFASSVPLATRDSAEARNHFVATGIDHPFPLIYATDMTHGLNGRARLVVLNEHQLDDSVDSTRCIRLDDFGGDTDVERAYQCVEAVGRFFPSLKPVCPAYNDPNRDALFVPYRRALNAVLGATNAGSTYLLARSDGDLPTGVLTYLNEWLDNLRIFECVDPDSPTSNLMHGRHGELGAWYTQGLWLLARRIDALNIGASVPASDPSASGKAANALDALIVYSEKADRLTRIWTSIVGRFKWTTDKQENTDD